MQYIESFCEVLREENLLNFVKYCLKLFLCVKLFSVCLSVLATSVGLRVNNNNEFGLCK